MAAFVDVLAADLFFEDLVRTSRPSEDADARWAERRRWLVARLQAKDYGEAVDWLNRQSDHVIKRHFLRRVKLSEAARLHFEAKRRDGVGPDSRLAKASRYYFVVYMFRVSAYQGKWERAGLYVNGLSPRDLREELRLVPLSFISRIHRGAVARVGPRSAAALVTSRSEEHPAFLPPRSTTATDGSLLLDRWSTTTNGRKSLPIWRARESTLVDEVLAGNIPGWLRQWKPVTLSYTLPSNEVLEGTVFVLPDYLCVGSDGDFVHVPFDQQSAQRIASAFNAVLPTAKICHAIYMAADATHRLGAITRSSLPPGLAQNSSKAYLEHSRLIRARIRERRITLGSLVAGHKKDVVLSSRHASQPAKIAFHGFYRSNGIPYQPCYDTRDGSKRHDCNSRQKGWELPSVIHGEGGGYFSDYSQGVRLMHRWMILNGQRKKVAHVLGENRQFKLLSAESQPIDPARVPPPP